MDKPSVSIGLPVYNGADYLETTLRSLLRQDYQNGEIVICDNASTDATQSICRRFAQGHPNVRYFRNPENIGPMPNFVRAVEHARGKYFMWAAHDDRWRKDYVSTLVDLLGRHPKAVLATATVIHVDSDGTPGTHRPDRPAAARSKLGNLKVFLADHAASWIYGLYQTTWLREHCREFQREAYPVWGGDVLWMVSVLLRYQVVGTRDTTMLKRLSHNAYKPTSETAKLRHALRMLYFLTRIVPRYSPRRSLAAVALPMTWHYTYRRYVRRGNPLKTLRRLAKLPFVAIGPWLREPVPQQGEKRRLQSERIMR